MSEMIERVAKAVAAFEPCRGDDGVLCKWQKCHCKNIARAAIEAMREPTEEMCFAPDRSGIGDDGPESKEIYQAMIDEALK